MELTQSAKRLLEDMRAIPPDFEKLKRDLEAGIYSPEDISMAAMEFVESDCFVERRDAEELRGKRYGSSFVPDLHSAFLYELVSLLLPFGLDPNAIFDGLNIMYMLKYVDNEYVGADTLRLLFEHGGDPNLCVDGESNFHDIDFNVIFDSFEQNDREAYDSMVHCWFVYLGFDAKAKAGAADLDVFRVYDSDAVFDMHELRDHRNFTFGLSHVPSRGESWSLHIFDKRTMWEVARL